MMGNPAGPPFVFFVYLFLQRENVEVACSELYSEYFEFSMQHSACFAC